MKASEWLQEEQIELTDVKDVVDDDRKMKKSTHEMKMAVKPHLSCVALNHSWGPGA